MAVPFCQREREGEGGREGENQFSKGEERRKGEERDHKDMKLNECFSWVIVVCIIKNYVWRANVSRRTSKLRE